AVPEVVKFNREVGREYVAYVVLFDVPIAAGQQYCAGVHLAPDGRVVQGIGLPDVVAAPYKSTVISEAVGMDAASRQGVDRSRASAHLAYNPSSDSLVWEISEPTGRERNIAYSTTCLLNAHTGQLIGWSQGRMIFD